MTLRSLSLLTLPLLLALRTFGAPPPPLPAITPAEAGFAPDRIERLHRTLDGTVDAGHYAGYVLLLARDGRLVDWHAHGLANVTTGQPIRQDSIVRLFSMSKLVTTVAALILVEEGKLRLSDRVDRYLPALQHLQVFTGGTADAPVLEDARSPITVHQLLDHTAGLFYFFDAPPALVELQNRADLWNARDLEDFVARVATVPLADQPGTTFRYGIATDVLGAIIEKVSGQPLDGFFQERIFAPLGMSDSGFWVPAGKQDRRARIHVRDASGRLVLNPDHSGIFAENCGPDHGLRSGGAGLYSTIADYARFAQMLLNGGQLDGRRILGRKTVEFMTRNHLSVLADPHVGTAKDQGFGLGVRVITDLGAGSTLGSVGTYGWDGIATTFVQIDPSERTVALLFLQHLPFNEDNVFELFANGWYSALEN